MRFALRKRRFRFPPDMIQRLDVMGRYELDPVGSGVDSDVVVDTIVQLHADAQADPEGFLAGLGAVVADDTGGFATYGASRLVWELLGSGTRNEDALALLDRAIAFKRERGLSGRHLTGYELSRWHEVNGPGTW